MDLKRTICVCVCACMYIFNVSKPNDVQYYLQPTLIMLIYPHC